MHAQKGQELNAGNTMNVLSNETSTVELSLC